jgi:hypothetical protein
MKSLQHHLTEYVAARRSLGTRLEEPAQTLVQFVSFLARKNARFITIQFALEWAQQSRPNVQRATWARKLAPAQPRLSHRRLPPASRPPGSRRRRRARPRPRLTLPLPAPRAAGRIRRRQPRLARSTLRQPRRSPHSSLGYQTPTQFETLETNKTQTKNGPKNRCTSTRPGKDETSVATGIRNIHPGVTILLPVKAKRRMISREQWPTPHNTRIWQFAKESKNPRMSFLRCLAKRTWQTAATSHNLAGRTSLHLRNLRRDNL